MLPKRTYNEEYNLLVSNNDRLEYWKNKLRPKFIKEFRKEKRFPAWRWEELSSPIGGKYIVFFYVEDRKYIENPIETLFYTYYVKKNVMRVVKWDLLQPEFVGNGQMTPVPLIDVYTNHFLLRYNERFLKINSLNEIDIAGVYLSRNLWIVPIEMNKDIYEKFSEDDKEANYGILSCDGFCGARHSVENVSGALKCIYTTFLNKSLLKEIQITAINKEHDKGLETFFEKYEEVKHLLDK